MIQGIDSFEYGLYIADYDERLRQLSEQFGILKYGIKNEIVLNGLSVTVERHGDFYPYHLECNDFEVLCAYRRTSNKPDLKIIVKCDCLWRLTAEGAYKHIKDWLSGSGFLIVKSSLKRLDICTDTDEVRFVPNDLHGFVARTKVRDRWRSDKKFTGFTIGKGNILCRIYDKTLEIRAESGKIWFHPLWKNNGWDGKKKVSRRRLSRVWQQYSTSNPFNARMELGREHALARLGHELHTT